MNQNDITDLKERVNALENLTCLCGNTPLAPLNPFKGRKTILCEDCLDSTTQEIKRLMDLLVKKGIITEQEMKDLA